MMIVHSYGNIYQRVSKIWYLLLYINWDNIIYTYTHIYIYIYIHTCMHACMHAYIHTSMHCIALHCITLHYSTVHYITLHYITYIHILRIIVICVGVCACTVCQKNKLSFAFIKDVPRDNRSGLAILHEQRKLHLPGLWTSSSFPGKEGAVF